MKPTLERFNYHFGQSFTQKDYEKVMALIDWDAWTEAEDAERDEFFYDAIEKVLIEKDEVDRAALHDEFAGASAPVNADANEWAEFINNVARLSETHSEAQRVIEASYEHFGGHREHGASAPYRRQQ